MRWFWAAAFGLTVGAVASCAFSLAPLETGGEGGAGSASGPGASTSTSTTTSGSAGGGGGEAASAGGGGAGGQSAGGGGASQDAGPSCGDMTVQPPEECDPPNVGGCNATCRICTGPDFHHESAGGSRCFELFRERLTQADAKAACALRGGYLVSIHHLDLMNEIVNWMPTQTEEDATQTSLRVWVGANKVAGEWEWTDHQETGDLCGSCTTPSQVGNAICITLTREGGGQPGFVGEDCGLTRSYVCTYGL